LEPGSSATIHNIENAGERFSIDTCVNADRAATGEFDFDPRGCSPRLRSSRCPGGDLGLPTCSGHLVGNGDGVEPSAANVIDLLNATLTPPSVNQGRIDVVLTGDRADAGARHQCFQNHLFLE